VSLESSGSTAGVNTWYLAAFILDGLVSPRDVLRSRPSLDVVRGWTRDDPVGDADVNPPLNSAGLIQDHESIGAARFGETLFMGTWQRDPRISVVLGNLGVGFVVVGAPGEWDAAFERRVSPLAQEAISEFCFEVSEWLPVESKSARPVGLLPGAILLWWHRVVFTQTDSRALEVVVDDGFTRASVPGNVQLEPGASPEATGTVRGLLIATEDWLMADTTNRLLTEHLAGMDYALQDGDWRAIATFMEAGGELVREAQFLKLYMDERNRYLATSRRVVWRKARESWGLDAEVNEIDARASAIHMQLQEAAQLVQQRRDRSRNLILFAIGLFTAIQSLLVIYDFSVNDDTSVSATERVAGALTALVAGLLLLFGLSLWRRRL